MNPILKIFSLSLIILVLCDGTYNTYNKGYYYNPYLHQMYKHYLMKGYYPRQQILQNFLHGKRYPHNFNKGVEAPLVSMKEAYPDPRDALKNPQMAPVFYDQQPINIINMKNHNYPPAQSPSRNPIKIYNVNNHHEAPVIPAEPQNIHITNIDQEIPAAKTQEVHYTQPNVMINNIDQAHETSEVISKVETPATQIIDGNEEVVINRIARNEPAHLINGQSVVPNVPSTQPFVINRLPMPERLEQTSEINVAGSIPETAVVENQIIDQQPAEAVPILHEAAPALPIAAEGQPIETLNVAHENALEHQPLNSLPVAASLPEQQFASHPYAASLPMSPEHQPIESLPIAAPLPMTPEHQPIDSHPIAASLPEHQPMSPELTSAEVHQPVVQEHVPMETTHAEEHPASTPLVNEHLSSPVTMAENRIPIDLSQQASEPGFVRGPSDAELFSTDGSHIPAPGVEDLSQPDMTGFSEELNRIARQTETN